MSKCLTSKALHGPLAVTVAVIDKRPRAARLHYPTRSAWSDPRLLASRHLEGGALILNGISDRRLEGWMGNRETQLSEASSVFCRGQSGE